MIVKYNFNFFNPTCMDDAKKIILTDNDVPDQWETETKWTMKFFHEINLFNQDSTVLDWGCGIGRLAKPIIEEFNCKVVGVDFQPNMLKYAMEYVNHPNFTAIDNKEFSQLPDDYFTEGIAIWALQHSVDTKAIIKNIRRKLKFNGKFCVFDADKKSWPVTDIDQSQNTDDVLINVIGETDETMHGKNYKWAHLSSNNLRDLKNYYSAENIESFLREKETDVVLSEFLSQSWRGIFINNKK